MDQFIEHASLAEAQEAHREAFLQACASGKWMAAVWCDEGDSITLVKRTTYGFARGDLSGQRPSNFDIAIQLLKRVCDQDVQATIELPDALPTADLSALRLHEPSSETKPPLPLLPDALPSREARDGTLPERPLDDNGQE
jgi:hypothetical protein